MLYLQAAEAVEVSPSLQITIVITGHKNEVFRTNESFWRRAKRVIGLTPFNFFQWPIIRCERSEFHGKSFNIRTFSCLSICGFFMGFQMKENAWKRGVRSEAKNPYNFYM
jgi:hypothetical protein